MRRLGDGRSESGLRLRPVSESVGEDAVLGRGTPLLHKPRWEAFGMRRLGDGRSECGLLSDLA